MELLPVSANFVSGEASLLRRVLQARLHVEDVGHRRLFLLNSCGRLVNFVVLGCWVMLLNCLFQDGL